MTPPGYRKEWKCRLCGAWRPMSKFQCIHLERSPLPTVAQLIAQRESGIDSAEVVTGAHTRDTWTPNSETRTVPDGSPI